MFSKYYWCQFRWTIDLQWKSKDKYPFSKKRWLNSKRSWLQSYHRHFHLVKTIKCNRLKWGWASTLEMMSEENTEIKLYNSQHLLLASITKLLHHSDCILNKWFALEDRAENRGRERERERSEMANDRPFVQAKRTKCSYLSLWYSCKCCTHNLNQMHWTMF